MMRVYTWGKQGERYETAFVESDVCGKLPIARMQVPGAAGDVTFSFQDLSGGVAETRKYEMHQTIVRRGERRGAMNTCCSKAPPLITAFHRRAFHLARGSGWDTLIDMENGSSIAACILLLVCSVCTTGCSQGPSIAMRGEARR